MSVARSLALRDMANFKSGFRIISLTCLATILCYLAGQLGYALKVPPDYNASFWPATPLLAALVLLAPRRIRPVLIAAGLGAMALTDLQHGAPLRSVIRFFAGDVVAVVVVTLGISWLFQGVPQLESAKTFAKYCAIAVVLAPLSSAFLGASSGQAYWPQWRLWFFSDALAFLTVMPAILSWVREGRAWARNTRNYLELAALVALLLVSGYFAFLGKWRGESPVLLYSLVPLLVWAAWRLGIKGVASSIIIVALLSIWGAAHDTGPFAASGLFDKALPLQIFLFFAAIPFMLLAVLAEERKQTNFALRDSEQRFRLIANTVPVMIWMSGPDKLCIYFNRPWLAFTGRSLQAELGNGWAEGVHADDVQRCLEIYRKAFDRGEPFDVEYRLRRHDGEYRWVLGHGVPRHDSDGSFAGYIGSAIDVTEHKLAEENRELFRSVFECSAVGMALVADDGRWIRVNKALCEILGYSEQELLATDFQSLTHPDDLDADLAYAQKVFTGQLRFYHMEKRYIHKQGHVVWVTLTGSAVPDAFGKVSYGVAQVQDITARRNAEAALRQEQEELQRLAGRLITVQEEERRRIARDLHDDLSQRVALLSIDLDLLHQSLPGGAEAARELERMRRETDELVRDMRRLSHNEHHPQLALGLQHGVASFCHDFSKQHGIAAKLIHEGDLKQIPETVSFTLFRVLQEAMSNVAKHSGADRVTVRLGVHSGQVLLRVTDQGRGFEIGSEHGLGLISMRERLRLVGGTMRVNSAPLYGTDVEAVVPIQFSRGAVSVSAWA